MDFDSILLVGYCEDGNNQNKPGDVISCNAVKRLAWILDNYKNWCEEAPDLTSDQSEDDDSDDDEEKEEEDGFHCFVMNTINELISMQDDEDDDDNKIKELKKSISVILLNDYNHLLLYHNTRDAFEVLHDFFTQQIYDGKGCNYDKCQMLERNNRDRSEITQQETKRRRLYHGYHTSKEIIFQQTADRIHSLYFHSYDLGFKLTRNDRESIRKVVIDTEDDEKEAEQMDDDDEDHILDSKRLRKVCKILKERRRRDTRGRNGRNKNNKFTTIATANDILAQKSVILKMDQNKDSHKDLLNDQDDFKENGANNADDDLPKFAQDQGGSGKPHHEPLRNRDVEAMGDQYSFSWRYYYWLPYLDTKRNNAVEHDDDDGKIKKSSSLLPGIGIDNDNDIHDIEPGNNGYEIWEWYIAKKYSNLKTELTNNTCCKIGIKQWDDLTEKAESFMECDEIGKKLKSYGEWLYNYGIEDETPISLDHIISLLLYCNYDVLQAKFSETFRRLDNEKDDSIKKRHREFANWGRLLREAVELFGDNIGGQYTDSNGEQKINNSIKNLKFYHGINCELLFPRTIARFNGPTSTTCTIAVAMAFTNSKGLCLQLKRKDPEYKHSSFFNCVPLSDFSYEEERFFIGGLEPLQISTIIHTKTNTNYRKYIKALNNLQNFIEGFNDGWAIHKVTNSMKKNISAMFKYYGMEKYDENKYKLPEYILNLFRAYANSVTKIDLYFEAINSEESFGKLGFKAIKNEVMLDPKVNDGNKPEPWIKMDLIGNIFRKCEELHVRSGFSVNMVILNKLLMKELVGFIKSNNVIERYQQLNKIYIYGPKQEMKWGKALKTYGKECQKHGWTLSFDKGSNTLVTLKLDRNKFMKKNLNNNNKNNKDEGGMFSNLKKMVGK